MASQKENNRRARFRASAASNSKIYEWQGVLNSIAVEKQVAKRAKTFPKLTCRLVILIKSAGVVRELK